jgi:hypothetical protein
MIKMLSVFLFLFVTFYMGIEVFRMMSGKERWQFAKTLSYSLAISLVVVLFLVGIVVLF